MKHLRACFLVLFVVLLAGCGTTYYYYGCIEAENSVGEMRSHLIRWSRTERPFWYDECSETIELLAESSNYTVNFLEKEEGIVFLRTQDHKGAVPGVDTSEPCGLILGAEKVKDLGEGTLRLKIFCVFDSTEATMGTMSQNAYLKAREEPYKFYILRKKSSEFEGRMPSFSECRE